MDTRYQYRMLGMVVETDRPLEAQVCVAPPTAASLRFEEDPQLEVPTRSPLYQATVASISEEPLVQVTLGAQEDGAQEDGAQEDVAQEDVAQEVFISFARTARFAIGKTVIRYRHVTGGPEDKPEDKPAGPNADLRRLLELRWLGPVMALYLERSSLPVLHASAVVCADQAIGFLAGSRAGKSSLAVAEILAGGALLSDDLVALEPGADGWRIRPSYPQMRLWPDAVARLSSRLPAARLEPVHAQTDKVRVPIAVEAGADCAASPGFGRFCPEVRPLCCLYLPQRLDDPEAAIRIQPLSPQEALFELLRCSFLPPDLLAAVGLQATRLEQLATLVREVPVKRLCYPTGYEHLPRVHDAVLADLC